MNNDAIHEPEQDGDHAQSGLRQLNDVQIPQYRRNIKPKNLTLSANDLKEFSELIDEANERAKTIEKAAINKGTDEETILAAEQIDKLMVVEYDYKSLNEDLVIGLGIPNTDDRLFPNDIMTFFVSSSANSKRVVNKEPLNFVDVFLSFEKPSLKMDLLTFPSNPTENRSVANSSDECNLVL